MALIGKNLPYCTHRYALFVSYLGTKYNGSQRLVARGDTGVQNTVQEALECSLESLIPKKRCRMTACSRTDKGVHALMNCYTLPLMDTSIIPPEDMKRKMNLNLMKANHEILVNQIIMTPLEFHPRKSAQSREYIYRIGVVEAHKNPKLSYKHLPDELVCSVPVTELYKILPLPRLNVDKAQEVIELMNGTHDFASFSFQTKPGEDTMRTVEINLLPASDNLFTSNPVSSQLRCYNIHFKSRAFLYNQVRRMVGAIITYASYETVKLKEIKSLFDYPSNHWNPKILIAEPWGLFLSRINYDKSEFETKQVERIDQQQLEGMS